jgi:hypothetical protein
MKNLIIQTILFWIFLLVIAATFSSCDKEGNMPTDPIANAGDLTENLNDFHQHSEFPGFATFLVQNDGVIYQQAFEQADTPAEPLSQRNGAALVKAVQLG